MISTSNKNLPGCRAVASVRSQTKLKPRLFETLAEISIDAIVVFDQSQNIRFFNRGAECMFGVSSNEMRGQTLDALLPEWIRYPQRNYFRAFAESDDPDEYLGGWREITVRRSNGAVFLADARIARVDENGEIVYSMILR